LLSRRSFLYVSGAALAASVTLRSQEMRSVPPELDHLIVGTRDLEEGIAYLEKLSGYRAAYGGAHPGRGTRNALLKLGPKSYLEILAPDPEQPALTWHKELPTLDEPLLVGWALRASHLETHRPGSNCVDPISGSRSLPSGEILRWTLVLRQDDRAGILPFFIEWDAHSKHPSEDAPGGCLVVDLTTTGHLIETPPPSPGYDLRQNPSKPAQLRATIAGQLGEFVLTSKSVPSEFWTSH
jgi:hypothetical protein